MARSGDQARAALLDAAERLFAERGVEGVSLRDVSAQAGQRNHSATQYHFGDRAGLVAAVFERRMSVINARRTDLMASFDAAGCGQDLDAIVQVGVVPIAEYVCAAAGWYGRFLLRARTEVFAMEVLRTLNLRSALRANMARLDAALAHAPRAIRVQRSGQLEDLVVTTLARWEWARDRGQRRLAPPLLIADLVNVGIALLGAPVGVPGSPARAPLLGASVLVGAS